MEPEEQEAPVRLVDLLAQQARQEGSVARAVQEALAELDQPVQPDQPEGSPALQAPLVRRVLLVQLGLPGQPAVNPTTTSSQQGDGTWPETTE